MSMKTVAEDDAYLSPAYKLRVFFEKSRDRWKAKALERKQHIRRLEKRIAALEASRQMWKERAKSQHSPAVPHDGAKQKRT